MGLRIFACHGHPRKKEKVEKVAKEKPTWGEPGGAAVKSGYGFRIGFLFLILAGFFEV